jgi:hypothetical protein
MQHQHEAGPSRRAKLKLVLAGNAMQVGEASPAAALGDARVAAAVDSGGATAIF